MSDLLVNREIHVLEMHSGLRYHRDRVNLNFIITSYTVYEIQHYVCPSDVPTTIFGKEHNIIYGP
jgi:hypothetical protein